MQLHGPNGYLFQIAGFTMDPREKGSVLYMHAFSAPLHARSRFRSTPSSRRPPRSVTVPGDLLWLDPLGDVLLLSLAGGPANNMVWSHDLCPLVYRAACV